ncbi:MAG: LysE family translocator [Thiomicrorhabdus sp.]|nr:LysE family translocator [Thiomicrorhabdus sp.]
MIPADSLITFIIASLVLINSPGPDLLFVITQSAIHGARTGILVTLGLVSGLIFHTSLVAFGVAAIILTSEFAFTALKILGAMYLLYLAWQAFHAHSEKLSAEKNIPKTAFQLYRRGIIMNITNPKVTVFFLAFLPQFVSADNGSVISQVFIFGAIFMALGLSSFIAISLAAGKLGNWLNQSEKAQLYLNRFASLVFVGLALNLLI